MTKRKLTLIIADVLLLGVCIFQLIRHSSDSAKVFAFKDTPDEIIIDGTNGTVKLVCQDDSWFIGDEMYPATQGVVDSIIDTLSSIRTLDKVGSANNDSILERYELTDEKKVVVTASKEGKVLRTLEIGKESSATAQGYITIDGGKDIYLASGSLRYSLDKSVDDLRSKIVWEVDSETISSVKIDDLQGSVWGISKLGSGEGATWNVSGADIDVDSSKAADWFNGFASLTVSKWYEKGADLGGNHILKASITAGTKNITLDLYEIPAETEEGNSKYWGKCNESPYPFEIAVYAAQKFQKNAEELAK